MSLAHKILAAVVAIMAPQMNAQQRRAELIADVLLDSIAQVESGNDPHAIGKRGERGRCQFMAPTWRRYTNAPLVRAVTDDEFTRKIERAHLAYVCGYLERARLPFDPALIAAAWRFGESNAVRFIRADSAQRAANLYWDAMRRRQEAAVR